MKIRVNDFLDLRIMLWLLAFAVLGALVSPFFGLRFAVAGLVLAVAALVLAVMSLMPLLYALHGNLTRLADIFCRGQDDQEAPQPQSSAATPRPN